MSEESWTVALIGGASGVGKTEAAYPLARHRRIGLTEIDDVVEALRAVTDARALPALHYWPDHPEECTLWGPERIVEQHLAVCKELAPAVNAVARNHAKGGPPLVLEGCYLFPAPLPEGCRAVFLVEDDEAQIVRNLQSREPDSSIPTRRARVSWLLGQRLAEEAARHGVPVLSPRPWKTLQERLAEALSG